MADYSVDVNNSGTVGARRHRRRTRRHQGRLHCHRQATQLHRRPRAADHDVDAAHPRADDEHPRPRPRSTSIWSPCGRQLRARRAGAAAPDRVRSPWEQRIGISSSGSRSSGSPGAVRQRRPSSPRQSDRSSPVWSSAPRRAPRQARRPRASERQAHRAQAGTRAGVVDPGAAVRTDNCCRLTIQAVGGRAVGPADADRAARAIRGQLHLGNAGTSASPYGFVVRKHDLPPAAAGRSSLRDDSRLARAVTGRRHRWPCRTTPRPVSTTRRSTSRPRDRRHLARVRAVPPSSHALAVFVDAGVTSVQLVTHNTGNARLRLPRRASPPPSRPGPVTAHVRRTRERNARHGRRRRLPAYRPRSPLDPGDVRCSTPRIEVQRRHRRRSPLLGAAARRGGDPARHHRSAQPRRLTRSQPPQTQAHPSNLTAEEQRCTAPSTGQRRTDLASHRRRTRCAGSSTIRSLPGSRRSPRWTMPGRPGRADWTTAATEAGGRPGAGVVAGAVAGAGTARTTTADRATESTTEDAATTAPAVLRGRRRRPDRSTGRRAARGPRDPAQSARRPVTATLQPGDWTSCSSDAPPGRDPARPVRRGGPGTVRDEPGSWSVIEVGGQGRRTATTTSSATSDAAPCWSRTSASRGAGRRPAGCCRPAHGLRRVRGHLLWLWLLTGGEPRRSTRAVRSGSSCRTWRPTLPGCRGRGAQLCRGRRAAVGQEGPSSGDLLKSLASQFEDYVRELVVSILPTLVGLQDLATNRASACRMSSPARSPG